VEKVSLMNNEKIRVYCDGIYDLFHIGHMKSLEQAKKSFPNVYLLVGVCGDDITREKKGPTVLNQQERYESVRHCKWVDQVIEDAPWIITKEFLQLHRIDYVAHDDIPYADNNSQDVYSFVKKIGKFHTTQRTMGISTSDLITRIIKNYEIYLERNIKRGVTAAELNITVEKEQQVLDRIKNKSL
jgi:choline-phosphate cytidylyltransferase